MPTATKTAAVPQATVKVSATKEPKKLSAIGLFLSQFPGGIRNPKAYAHIGML